MRNLPTKQIKYKNLLPLFAVPICFTIVYTINSANHKHNSTLGIDSKYGISLPDKEIIEIPTHNTTKHIDIEPTGSSYTTDIWYSTHVPESNNNLDLDSIINKALKATKDKEEKDKLKAMQKTASSDQSTISNNSAIYDTLVETANTENTHSAEFLESNKKINGYSNLNIETLSLPKNYLDIIKNTCIRNKFSYTECIRLLNKINKEHVNKVEELQDGTLSIGLFKINSAMEPIVESMIGRSLNLKDIMDNTEAFIGYYTKLKEKMPNLNQNEFDSLLVKTLCYRHNN